MKNLIFLFLSFLILSACSVKNSQSITRINVEIEGLPDSWVKLRLWDFDPIEMTVIDSVFARNQKFEFSLSNVKGGYVVDFYLEEFQKQSRWFFIEKGESVVVMGSASNFIKSQYNEEVFDIKVSGGKSNVELYAKEAIIDSLGYTPQLIEKFAQEDSNSLLSPLFMFATENSEKYFDHLSSMVKESYYGEKFAEKKARLDRVGYGQRAADINCTDFLGTPFSLYGLNKRFTLIEFWASWCRPCRASHPELISLFQKYNNRGLDIVSISVDDPEYAEKWKKAIESDKIGIWPQVLMSDCQETNIQDLYYIPVLPVKYLIDHDHKIVKRFEGGKINEINLLLDSLLIN